MATNAGEDYSDEYRRVLAGEFTAPQAQGVQRRQAWAEEGTIDTRSDWQKERDAAVRRFSSEPATLRGVYNRIIGDDAAADAAYAQALKTQKEAAQLDSNVSTNWREWSSPGDVLAGVRKTLTMSAPDMGLALLGGGVGRGLARRTVGNIERAAAVKAVEGRLADEGIDSLVGRRVAANAAATQTAAAADARVAQAQFQDAIDTTGAQMVRRAPGAQARIERAGNIGAVTGATVGALPGVINQDTEALSHADRAATLRMLPFHVGQAWLEPYTEMRLAGRLLHNPYVAGALEGGLKTTRGALAQLPGRVGKEALRNFGSEALTEGAQGMLQNMGLRAAKGENPLASLASMDDWSSAIDQAIVGGLAGTAMGAPVETVNASVPAALDAGRWAWDQTGRIRQALRNRIDAAAARRRAPAGTEDASPAPDGAPEAAGGGLGSTLRAGLDTASQVFGRAKQGATNAARRFQQAVNDMTQHDDVDAATDDAMDFVQRAVYPAYRSAVPDLGDGMTGLHQMLARGINPASPVWDRHVIARTLVNAMHDYVTGEELTPVRGRALQRAFDDPASGVSPAALDFLKENVSQIQTALKARRDDGSSDSAEHMEASLREAYAPPSAFDDDGSSDSAEQMGAAEDAAQDWNSGISERTARQFDAQVTPQQRLDTIETRMQRAIDDYGPSVRSNPRYKALEQDAQNARAEWLHTVVRPGDIFTRNDKARKEYDAELASPNRVRLQSAKDVFGNGKFFQPQLVRLSSIIGRARDVMRRDGTAEGNISAFSALQYALGVMHATGMPVDTATFTPGTVKDAKGNPVLELTQSMINALNPAGFTPREGAEIRPQRSTDYEKVVDFVAGNKDPGVSEAAGRDAAKMERVAQRLQDRVTGDEGKNWTRAQRDAAWTKIRKVRKQARTLQRLAEQGQQKQGHNESAFEDNNSMYLGRAYEPPPGTRMPDGSFVPTMSPILEAYSGSPHADVLAELFSELRKGEDIPPIPERKNFNSQAEYESAMSRALRAEKAFNARLRKYDPETAQAGPIMAARVVAGREIAKRELRSDLAEGKITKKQYDQTIEELGIAGALLPHEYLERALNGEFDDVGARHQGAEGLEPVRGRESDHGGGTTIPARTQAALTAYNERKATVEEQHRAAMTPEERRAENNEKSRARGVDGKTVFARAPTKEEQAARSDRDFAEAYTARQEEERAKKTRTVASAVEKSIARSRKKRKTRLARRLELLGKRAKEKTPAAVAEDKNRALRLILADAERMMPTRDSDVMPGRRAKDRAELLGSGVQGPLPPRGPARGEITAHRESPLEVLRAGHVYLPKSRNEVQAALAERARTQSEEAANAESRAVPGRYLLQLTQHWAERNRAVRRIGPDQARKLLVIRPQVNALLGFDTSQVVSGAVLLQAEDAMGVTVAPRGEVKSIIALAPHVFTKTEPTVGDATIADRLVRVLAHESSHALDNALAAAGMRASERPKFAAVMEEIREAVSENAPRAVEWFGWALGHPKESREVFAQIGALKARYPEVLHAYYPKSAAFFDAAVAKYADVRRGQRESGHGDSVAPGAVRAQQGTLEQQINTRIAARGKRLSASGGEQAVRVVEHSSSGYSRRTKHNADSAGATVALAMDFSTAGERATRSYAGEKYIGIALDTPANKAAAELVQSMRRLGTTTLNVAGNGLATLSAHGMTQADADQRVFDILQAAHETRPIRRVVTGGQTGVDIAGAAAARALGIPVTVTMPKGFVQRGADGKDSKHTADEINGQIERAAARLKAPRAADRADARSAAVEKSRQRARVVPAKESGTQRDTQAKTHRKVVLHERPINVWAGTGENAQFSNLAARPFELREHKYLTVEHAYQSLKSGKFDVDTYSKYTRAGQKVPGRLGVKTEGGWNIKLMDRLVYESFAQNPKAAKELLATGAAPFTHTQDKGVWNTAFPAALEKARQQLRAQAGVQNDELTPKQTDAIDAGAESAAKPDGPHNLKAEQSMLNAVLKALGIDNYVLKLTKLLNADAKGNKGGGYKRAGRSVFINPNLHGAERVEVLMHELGHHIIWNEIAKHVEGGLDAVANMSLAEGLDALAKGNPELYAALRKDFDAWNAGGRRSQSPTHRYLRMQEEGLQRSFKDDHDAFHEWLADNIARSLLGKRQVVGIVGKFFDAIATQLRKAWSIISGNPQLKPAKSVDAWVKQMLDANVAAVKEATGQTQSQAQAESSVRAAAAAAGAQSAAQVSTTPPQYTKENIEDLVGFIENTLPLAARQILDRVFGRGVVLERLREVFHADPVLVRMMDHPAAGMSARIALGYLAWQQGAFNVGPQGQSTLMSLSDSLLKIAGVAGDGVLAQKVLNDIQTGTIQRFIEQDKKYNPRDIVARRNRHQRVLNWVNKQIEDGAISRALSAFWTGISDRMRGSGIPALHELAAALQRPAGTAGQQDLGLATNIRVQTQRWNRRLREIVEPLSEKQQTKVMRALQRRLVSGDKAYEALSPDVRKAVEAVREMLRDAYAYQRQAGYTVHDVAYTETYAPVLMDLRNDNARAKLTALYSKPEYARDVLIAAGFVKPSKKGVYNEAEIRKLRKDPEKMKKAVEYLVRAAANDERVAQDNKRDEADDGTRFHFRHQNARLSAFIYKHGNPDDIKTFASLQTTSMGDLFARYFVPMIRWTEAAKTFGEVEQVFNDAGKPVFDAEGHPIAHMNPRAKLDALLERVKSQGGTDDDVAFAENAVRAAIGVYGADGSPTIAALSPTLANKLKGRKAQGYIEGLQAYQNLRLLPLALLSNLVDPMGIAVRTGGTFGEAWAGFKEGMSFIMDTLGKDPDAAKQMLAELEDFDVSEDFLPAIAANATFDSGQGGKARAVNDFVFKWNGVQTWVTATRVMALYAGQKFLLKHARVIDELGGKANRTGAEEKAVQTSLRYLDELGIPREAIKELEGRPGKVEANEYTRAALRQFVDEAILRPNSQQAPLWMSDPYMGLVSQYKAFAYAIFDQIGGRIKHEVSRGNARVMLAALMYVPVVMAAELLREGIQTAFEGDDRRKKWGPADYAQLALMKSGLPGPRVQIGNDIWADVHRAQIPGTSQLGPTASQGGNVLNALEGKRGLGTELENSLPAAPLYRKWGGTAQTTAHSATAS